jgi:hypothetical protein
VFTPAHVVFCSLLFLAGFVGYAVYSGMPMSNDFITAGVVGALVVGLLIATYSLNKEKE